jgi:copper(I)-binding protein
MIKKTIFAALCLLAAGTAYAADSAQLAVTEAWMRASLGQVPSTAAYFKIENRGTTEDKLLAVATPVAAMAHVHGMAEENGVMTMNAVGALVIKPGETVELAPGGLHVMVMNMKAPIKAGASVPLVLTFERAGRIEVQAEVRGLNDSAGHKH